MSYQTIVVHSGGMDSSLCLAAAVARYGAEQVLSMSFRYGQRHSAELERAKLIAEHFGVKNIVVPIDCLQELTTSALLDNEAEITHTQNTPANTMVVGRNGLMVRIAAIHANHLGAHSVYVGVIEVESANSGYRDCSRLYMDKLEDILRLDFADPSFVIETPLVKMTKRETMEYGHHLGVLAFLLETTITCYRGVEKLGCQTCPACLLRNEGIHAFLQDHPGFEFSYKEAILALGQAN